MDAALDRASALQIAGATLSWARALFDAAQANTSGAEKDPTPPSA